jgi:phosphorylase kinase alpha/beta subunit
MVDSLAPSVTNLLVRGKIVTIGIFGHEETVIDRPVKLILIIIIIISIFYSFSQMRPNDIFNILYSENIFGRSIFHAVLLQELLLNITVFMNTSPVC